jgi:hypothetical protein
MALDEDVTRLAKGKNQGRVILKVTPDKVNTPRLLGF